MNLNSLLIYDQIKNLSYNSAYIEYPIADIVKFNWKKILDPPPQNISKTTENELKIVGLSTKKRNKKDIELIYNVDQNLDIIFSDLTDMYGVDYPKQNIDEFYKTILPILNNIKNYWNRPRPAQLAKYYDIDIDLIETNTHDTPSYPSGHVVYSKLVALILKNLYPKIDNNKLNHIVDLTGKARIMQGVHYPSDNKASIVFTNFVFDKLNEQILNY